jgi:hypothetical protein
MKLSAIRHLTKAVIVPVLMLMMASGVAGAQALAAGPVSSNNAGSGFIAGLGLIHSDPIPAPPPTPTPSPSPLPLPGG